MNIIETTAEFDKWLSGLKDKTGKFHIIRRIDAAVVYMLLAGGDKSSQKRDVTRAINIVRSLKE